MYVFDELPLVSTFGRNLRLQRERRGWSQSELARQMVDAGWPKYSQVAVSRTEDGTRMVRLDEALELANIVGASLQDLLVPPRVAGLVHELLIATGSFWERFNTLGAAVQDYEEAQELLELRASRVRDALESGELEGTNETDLQRLRDYLSDADMALSLDYERAVEQYRQAQRLRDRRDDPGAIGES